MKASILIGVENYAEGNKIQGVKYAGADAQALAAVLAQHGFKSDDQELLIDGQATKTSVESAIRTTVRQLKKDDILYFSYAGHPFSNAGENYLACHDTRLSDIENTSVALSWVFAQFKQAKCRQIVLFLDGPSSGLLPGAELHHNYEELNEAELIRLTESMPTCVCFAACKSKERSHASSDLKHGIWMHHLIEAFDGRDRTALEGHRLTAVSLQNHLATAVPATLKKTNPTGAQTPWMCAGAVTGPWLADFEEIFAQRRAKRTPNLGQVKDSILLVESVVSAKRLSGYAKSKGHSLPDRHDHRAQAFINTIAAPDIKEDIEGVRNALKREFGFTRVQLSATHDEEGAATVTTPYFNYNVNVEQAADDPASVIWRRSIDAISNPDQVLSEAFEAVFANVFDTVELSLHDAMDLDQLIDTIEALNSDEIDVSYGEDQNITSCLVTIKGHDVSIEVTRNTFAVVHPRAASPRRLLQSLFDIQLVLKDTHRVTAIPFASTDSGH